MRIAAAFMPPSTRNRTRRSAVWKKTFAPLSGRATHGVVRLPSKEDHPASLYASHVASRDPFSCGSSEAGWTRQGRTIRTSCRKHRRHATRRTSPFWEGPVTAWRLSSLQFLQRQVHRRSWGLSAKLACDSRGGSYQDPKAFRGGTPRTAERYIAGTGSGSWGSSRWTRTVKPASLEFRSFSASRIVVGRRPPCDKNSAKTWAVRKRTSAPASDRARKGCARLLSHDRDQPPFDESAPTLLAPLTGREGHWVTYQRYQSPIGGNGLMSGYTRPLGGGFALGRRREM